MHLEIQRYVQFQNTWPNEEMKQIIMSCLLIIGMTILPLLSFTYQDLNHSFQLALDVSDVQFLIYFEVVCMSLRNNKRLQITAGNIKCIINNLSKSSPQQYEIISHQWKFKAKIQKNQNNKIIACEKRNIKTSGIVPNLPTSVDGEREKKKEVRTGISAKRPECKLGWSSEKVKSL